MDKSRKVILMMETSRTYGRSILRGIARYSRGHGNWIFYKKAPFYWKTGGGKVTLEKIFKMEADGLILREQRTRQQTEKFLAMGLPTVVSPYTEPFPGLPNIVTDDAAIGKMAAEYLLHRGFKQFAFCGFGQRYYWSRQRGKSFGQRIAEAGFKTHYYEYELPKSSGQHSWEKEQSNIADWLIQLPKPIGLMACNDDQGQYVLEACKIAGLAVPEQVAIIGLGNDDLICDLVAPPLSSIAVSAEKAGYEAAEALDKIMAGEKVTNQAIIIRPTHIVTRQSTNVFAVADRDVLTALRFIHRHAKNEAIQVDDVLRAVSLSRRSLYNRFTQILGRSVHEEIKRVRVNQLARLLVSTSLSISHIASDLGYTDIKNIARYFKQQKGMTPLEYRKRLSLK
ncbi:MAG: DNA-binding transcriptional regulator [Sedimentisphaerales bacterium]|jgi:LacI family transcriptional regulator|nr:DNA-binding transcriptional regulator [Sedimentisphaerales bacterium]